MSVSMKDRKSIIYAEVERLRALLDERDGQLAMQAESIRRLQQRCEEREAKSEAEFEAAYSEADEVTLSKGEIARRLAILMKRTVRCAGDGKFESYVDKTWVTVPQRVVRYATEG